jgi:glycosyltransferase involved in cell wall biosynthesis
VAPLVQTIHDLTPLVWPSPDTDHDARRWRRRAARLRDAARIVTVSRSSADQAIRLLGVDSARVEVVPNGVDPSYSPGSAPGDGDPYVLFVGAWGPHKGHAEAFATIAALADAGYPHVLRVAGPDDPWMQQRVQDVLARAVRPDRVELLGYVDDLVELYRRASALVFTSRAEGFGLPIVEAMACGTPVVAFSNTSAPEVAGDAAVLVPDGDVTAMVRSLRRVLDEPAFSAELREAGLRQAARFKWDDAADRYVQIFVDAARG